MRYVLDAFSCYNTSKFNYKMLFFVFWRAKVERNMLTRLLTTTTALLLCLLSHAQIYFPFQSDYSYLKGREASGLSASWMNSSFNYGSWNVANAPFRYGDGEGGTVLNDMRDSYSTVYLRAKFTASNIDQLDDINLEVDYDDGFAIWINGNLELQQNAPDNKAHNAFSTALRESGSYDNFTLHAEDLSLKEGENNIAVQVFNTSLESSDLYFDMKIEAGVPVPEAPKTSDSLQVVFSHQGGFYEENFSLKIEVPDNRYDLVYTIDGSNPQTSLSAKSGVKSATISVNPGSTNGRAKTPCYIVRAALVEGDLAPSNPLTQTYIFLSNVIAQKHPGGSFPTNNVNGQQLDWEMDSRITQSSKYRNEMEASFKAIPSISVVTDNDALFGSQAGIYVNALEHGIDWERFCSVELLNPDESDGFNVNAGLRIRGGWSRHDNYAKHAFRLFFRSEYGNGKLKYPLFEDEGVDEFDKIDLRTAQNYAWSNNQDHNTFIREVFSRDTQGEMGHPYTRSRYYHLYLNGVYWGLYQTQERSEARFAASYLGGQADDYDVVKVNGDYSYVVEATDGNLEKWQELWNYCEAGFSSNTRYFELLGRDSKGVVKKGAEVKVDIDNLIDYMILIFFGGNFDAPVSKFSGNSNPNNFYAIKKRDDKTRGFQFFIHDAEHSLLSEPVGPGDGFDENRVEIDGMNVSSFEKFHPQWLHEKLSSNAEYRLRFADRVEKHFFNNGVLTPENCEKRFLNRAEQIQDAIIAESARWGDGTSGGDPKTKEDDWEPEIDEVVYNYLQYRGDLVIEQLMDANLYSSTAAPDFKVNDKVLSDSKYLFDERVNLTITSRQAGAEIYMTTDGTDPRKVGGNVSESAQRIENETTIELRGTTLFKTRIKRGNVWSPMREMRVVKRYEDYFNIQVTELHYFPADSVINGDTVSQKSFEFIEMKNIGSHSVDMSGLYFETGIEYKFPQESMLHPGMFCVLASSSKWFYERYGVAPTGNYKDNLNNEGEIIRLKSDGGRTVLDFGYVNASPWPEDVQGNGYSLSAIGTYPTGDPMSSDFWKKSTFVHGSPFYDDLGWKLDAEAIDAVSLQIEVYPNPTSDFIFVKNAAEEQVKIEIYTLQGALVYANVLNDNSFIDLRRTAASSGLLLVKLQSNQEYLQYKILYQP